MSRVRFLLTVLLVSYAASRGWARDSVPSGPVVTGTYAQAPEAPKSRLSFHYPCSFTYEDGKPYEEQIPDRHCDYLRASLRNADQTFNALPTIESQKEFLRFTRDDAEAAYDQYIRDVARLLKDTDPAGLPKTLSRSERLSRLQDISAGLWTSAVKISKPFLWPPAHSESYLDNKDVASYAPETWPSQPYLQPLDARSKELDRAIRADQAALIDATSAALEKRLRRLPARADSKEPRADIRGLDEFFDGGQGRRALADVEMPSAVRAAATKEARLPRPTQPRVSDLRSSVPSIPKGEAARDERNYFARGVPAGLRRLKDDATLAIWRATGQTQTIGDPYGKASLIIQQRGPSCGVGAQYEALRARGEKAEMADLAREARDNGTYVSYRTSSGGQAGGMRSPRQMNALLSDHGVKSRVLLEASPEDLDESIRRGGDAIVTLKARYFYNNPAYPDGAGHIAYVSGAEIDKTGKVRGYYVNDTGTGEAARFIPAADFKKAWLKGMVAFDAP